MKWFQGHIQHNEENDEGWLSKLGRHIGGAFVQHDWVDSANGLLQYQSQFNEPILNDYTSWKTGRARTRRYGMLDGWDYEDNYTGHRPTSRLLYVDGSGALSNPQKRGKRGFGHVAVEVDGDVYNYTPTGLDVLPAHRYIHSVTHRQKDAGPQTVYAYPLGLNQFEKKSFVELMEQNVGKPYDATKRNCGTCTIEALSQGTENMFQPIRRNDYIPNPPRQFGWKPTENWGYTPSDVLDNVKQSGRIYGPTFRYLPPTALQTWDNGFWGVK